MMKQLSLINEPPEHDMASDDKYTPDSLFEPIIKVLGGKISLDPTADPDKRVPARHHITKADNCFATDWMPYLRGWGTIFMNPPYSDSLPFLEELCRYLSLDYELEAVTLTLSGVLQNKGCRPLLAKHKPCIVFPNGRINFLHGGGSNDRDVVFLLWNTNVSSAQQFATDIGGLLAEIK